MLPKEVRRRSRKEKLGEILSINITMLEAPGASWVCMKLEEGRLAKDTQARPCPMAG